MGKGFLLFCARRLSAVSDFAEVFSSLSPRPPSPPGKGEIFSLLVQGASPLASPSLRRRLHCAPGGLRRRKGLLPGGIGYPCGLRYLPECRKRQSPSFQKSFSFLTGGAGSQGVRGTGGKDMLPGQASAQLFRPYPPDPLPRRGRGRFQIFLCKGLRPLHPQACAGGGAGCRKVCRSGRERCPALSALPCRREKNRLRHREQTFKSH